MGSDSDWKYIKLKLMEGSDNAHYKSDNFDKDDHHKSEISNNTFVTF